MNLSESVRISTKRLDMAAATLDMVCAELEAPEKLAALLGAEVEPGWPPGEYDRNAQEFFRDCLQEGGESAEGWNIWYAMRKGNSQEPPLLVGAIGFVGPPDENGDVETGFSIMPEQQGRGYATELVQSIVSRAFMDAHVRRVLAHTTLQNPASCRVLEKAGFRRVSMDEETGVIRFEVKP